VFVVRLLRLAARLPLPLMQGLGAALGWLAWLASPVYRRRMRLHLARAGLGMRQGGYAAIGHAGRMVAELPLFWLRPPGAQLGERVSWSGTEHVDAALARGRGLLIVTPHLGAFEAIGQSYAERWGQRQPMTALYRPARQAWLAQLMADSRARPGLLTAPANIAGVRLMLRSLRQGATVGLLPDQVPPEGQGVWAPWFGEPAYTMTLLARLVQQSGCDWLPAWCERLPGGRFHVHVQAPAERFEPGADPAECAALVNRRMEALVRAAPAQYLWSYHRYKKPRALPMAEAGGAATSPAAPPPPPSSGPA
jgi:KDO2-lipid IV(A) lauroyltransferase